MAKRFTKLTAMLLSFIMLFSSVSLTAFATEGERGATAPVISQRIDKTADGLDENDQTNVTLTVPGEKIEMSSDIVLIVGEGSALKHEYFVELIHDMLTAADGTPTKIKVGLVTFGDTTAEEIVLPLSEMIDTVPGNTVAELSKSSDETAEEYEARIAAAVAANPDLEKDMDFLIARALRIAATKSKGVNLDSALVTARDMLIADTEVPAERKHVIVFSTGLTYTFDNEDGDFSVTIREESAGGRAQFVNFKYWQSQRHNSTSGGYKIPSGYVEKHTVDGVVDYKGAFLEYWDDIVEWIEKDQNAYVYTPGTLGEDGTFTGDTFTAFTGRLDKNYRPVEPELSKITGKAPNANGKNPLTTEAAQHAVGYERAQYEAYLIYKQMETPIGQSVTSVLKDEDGNNYVYPGLGFNCYALAAGKTAAMGEDDLWLQENQIGYNFMFMMGGENAANFRSGDATFFENIAAKILYTCADGSTVTDYIGYDAEKGDFDFIQEPDTMQVVYGVETYDAELIETKEGATASYGFNKKDDGTYSFNLDYYAGEADTEHFVWTFHEDVSMEQVASLTYKLQLTNKAEEPGEYKIETNEYAVLKPIDTKQHAGDWQYFPIPTVDYVVEKSEEKEPPTVTFKSGEASNISFMLIDKTGKVEFLYKVDIDDETSFVIPTEEGKISAVFVKQSTSGMFWFSENVDEDVEAATIACLKDNNPSYKGHNAIASGEGDVTWAFKNNKFVTYTFTCGDAIVVAPEASAPVAPVVPEEPKEEEAPVAPETSAPAEPTLDVTVKGAEVASWTVVNGVTAVYIAANGKAPAVIWTSDVVDDATMAAIVVELGADDDARTVFGMGSHDITYNHNKNKTKTVTYTFSK